MKLGEIYPSKYQRCIICNRVIINKRYNRYYKCYNEDKYDIIRGNNPNTIDEYYVKMNLNELTI